MNRTLLFTLALAACGGTKAPPVDAGSAPVEQVVGANVPADATSQAFARNLYALDISDFHPSDGGGAKFVYNTFKFNPDGSWAAAGYVATDEETMDCKESGTWTMDAAESEMSGSVNWVLVKTNCAGRDEGETTRALISIDSKGEAKFSFR